jgi:hypothetical protein
MRTGRIGLAAGCVALSLAAACSPAATDRPTPPPLPAPTGAPPPTLTPSAAADQFACTAIQLAAMGQWVQAESHWSSAASREEGSSNLAAAMAYIRLAEDSGTVATDQTDGASSAVQATDTATYNSDLAGDRAFTAGC